MYLGVISQVFGLFINCEINRNLNECSFFNAMITEPIPNPYLGKHICSKPMKSIPGIEDPYKEAKADRINSHTLYSVSNSHI